MSKWVVAMSDLVPHLLDLWSGWRPVATRRMFGGWGLYADGAMFGLVTGGVLYLKTDENNRAAFDAAGLRPFVFERQGQPVEVSFCEAPAGVLDDPAEAAHWAEMAWAAADRALQKKSGKPRAR